MTSRRWPLFALLALLAFGAFAAILMTRHHEQHLAGLSNIDLLGCTESATVSCDTVNTSAWSEVLGVPTATWALVTYILLAALAVLGLRGSRGAVAVIFGVGCLTTVFSAWLFYIAEVEVGFLCAWCLRMYVVNLVTPVLAWIAVRPRRPERRVVAIAIGVFASAAIVVVGAQRLYRRSLGPDAPPQVAGEPVWVPPEPVPLARDPDGQLAARSITGKTEDGAPATLAIAPGDAWKGSVAAAVTVVEFGDFQCGYCRRASGELARIHAAYGDRVLFVWKHYPLDPACNPGVKNRKHEYACAGAFAAVCAQQQGKFWPLHDALFANQKDLVSPATLRRRAADTGLDVAALDACLAGSAPAERVRSDGEAGRAMGLHGTPRIFVNGILQKPGAVAIARAIERALGSDEALAERRAQAFQRNP